MSPEPQTAAGPPSSDGAPSLTPPDGGAPPRLPRTYVRRQHLFTQLDRATRGPVTLLVAPTGTGKTLGAGGWARLRHPEGTVWVQADAHWDAERMRTLLDHAAAAGDEPLLVVVDDAHLLPAETVSLIDQRLSDAPTALRLLLLARWDLPLRRLVPELLGHLTVLRGDVLRLADDEVAVLVAEHARTDHPEVVEAITTQAQGWCAAVVLVSRAVAASRDPVAAAIAYARDGGGIAGQVTSEVFASLPSRERHLLLCVAGEETVTAATAVHLSRDPDAGEVLAHLEATGLLVTRLDDGVSPDEPAGAPTTRFCIHPLLAEVIRRRLVAGGVDVLRARATVAAAVALDVARGEGDGGFRRLVAVHEHEAAARLLAAEGITMLMRGEGAAVAAFARDHGAVLEAHPGTWLVAMLERWVAGDAEAARRWAERLGDRPVEPPDDPSTATAAAIEAFRGLVLTRLGQQDLDGAVALAQQLADDLAAAPGVRVHDHALLPQLLTELGITQNWTGDLVRAEQNLTLAAQLGRTRGLPALTCAATSHLALTQYMRGREQACVELARQALEQVERVPGWQPRFTRARAAAALVLADLPGLPSLTTPFDRRLEPGPAHPGDLATRFWLRMVQARTALREGAIDEAERVLVAPLGLPVATAALPAHLRIVLVIEQAFLAYLSGDRHRLAHAADEARELDAPGEHSLLLGLQADLVGDQRAAGELHAAAAAGTRFAQPASRELALTCHAQLADALGKPELALDLLREAATSTAVRNNAVPFLGWSRHGTPLSSLLDVLASRDEPRPGSWLQQVVAARTGQGDVAAAFSSTVATQAERDGAALPAVRLVLSARERDVLVELARGSTYADIARNLVVSENTVKTHVSNLYSKLSVSRRSEALAVARTMHLI
ncbi:LuxR C-terminal-related transcriptional regulator [Aeromicrobium massiliense]|uniref:LuxR C-terminal-related transcriptional regulator n=1 Tax=Aeromicrobium massiliense TaxID=1464554 RepID=UPI0005785258|nr:LuxR C-terminal-related transcriptional regulator [Aeromicrobium massiliense]